LIIDCDRLVKDERMLKLRDEGKDIDRLLYYAEIKKNVDALTDEYRRHKFLYFCDSVQLAKHLGVQDKYIFAFIPNEIPFNQILARLEDSQRWRRELMIRDRSRMLNEKDKNYITFGTIEKIISMIQTSFKLVEKI